MKDVIAFTTLATFKYLVITLLSDSPRDMVLLWLTTYYFAREVEV